MSSWNQTLVSTAERCITRRRYKKYKKKEKQKQKNQVLDWIHAFLWAACVVLILNQYLFQAYQIPSGSMMDTLLIKDRIFVNKLVYGPELLPGVGKVPGAVKPERTDVIIFENPTYLSKGPAFDITQRLLYMLTFSLVDIDRDESGAPKPHFLIKRAAAADGEWVRLGGDHMDFRLPGRSDWIAEESYAELSGTEYPVRKILDEKDYPLLRERTWIDVVSAYRLPLTEQDWASARKSVPSGRDLYMESLYRQEFQFGLNPDEADIRSDYLRESLGIYVPRGWVLPLGDNRDNSRDGRSFGPIPKEKVLGRAMFKYWPLDRFGAIR